MVNEHGNDRKLDRGDETKAQPRKPKVPNNSISNDLLNDSLYRQINSKLAANDKYG